MRYATLRDLLTLSLFGTVWADDTTFHPGPEDPETPGRFILLTRFGGPGLNTEDLFDTVGWQVKAVGQQGDYEDAEGLALVLDRYLVRNSYTQTIGGVRVKNIQRTGSPPVPLTVDDADRHQFVCSYYLDVEFA